MKFAFIYTGSPDLLTPQFTYADKGDSTAFCRVKDLEQACKVASVLVDEGYNLIELCGAFGEDGAKAVQKVVKNKASVGFVIRTSEQQELFNSMFNNSVE